MAIFDLFPCALGSYDLDRAFTDREMHFIRDLDTTKNLGNNTTSVDGHVLEHEDLRELKLWCQCCLDDYFNRVWEPANDVKVEITQSWCNYTQPGEMHHKHYHPNSYISGVLYAQAQEDIDKIWFYRDGFRELRNPCKQHNPWNSDIWWMPAITGRLYLFPSTMHHNVEPVDHGSLRISLSFNSFFKGQIGDTHSKTGLWLR